MMISPYSFKEQNKDKSVPELIKIRDLLIQKIQEYEQLDFCKAIIGTEPSPFARYFCDIKYLKTIIELLEDRCSSGEDNFLEQFDSNKIY